MAVEKKRKEIIEEVSEEVTKAAEEAAEEVTEAAEEIVAEETAPEEAEAKLRAVHPDWTPSDWALRFVQSLPGVEIALSGMGTEEQVCANIRPFEPLTGEETAFLAEVAEIIRGKTAIGCTGCGDCLIH